VRAGIATVLVDICIKIVKDQKTNP